MKFQGNNVIQSKEFREILMTKMRNFDFENGSTGWLFLGVGNTVNIDFDTILVTFSSIPVFRYYFDTDTGISYYEN